jgi:hypothetical protein
MMVANCPERADLAEKSAHQPLRHVDVGALVRLVSAVMASCECERGERHEECHTQLDRGWIVDTMLSQEQKAAFEQRLVQSRTKLYTNSPELGGSEALR